MTSVLPFTADGEAVRTSTHGIIGAPEQATDPYIGARGGTWDEATAGARAAHLAELAARGKPAAPPAGAGLQAIASETPEPAPVTAEVAEPKTAPAPAPAAAPAVPAAPPTAVS